MGGNGNDVLNVGVTGFFCFQDLVKRAAGFPGDDPTSPKDAYNGIGPIGFVGTNKRSIESDRPGQATLSKAVGDISGALHAASAAADSAKLPARPGGPQSPTTTGKGGNVCFASVCRSSPWQ